MILFPHGSLEINATHKNPYWGGGLLSLLSVRGERVAEIAPDIFANDLNFAEFFFGDMPMFGGWCKAVDDYVFVSFAPNHLKCFPIFTRYFVRLSSYRYRQFANIIGVVLALKKSERAKTN